ncbi:MAG: hypothetical protein U0163_19215 [Gemmatimonadaceae bacterium]
MRPNGSGLAQLTNAAGSDYHPDWSPDGSQIIWFGTRGQDTNLWLMNSDGTNAHQITFNQYADAHPDFFPSGLQIAYQCGTSTNDW